MYCVRICNRVHDLILSVVGQKGNYCRAEGLTLSMHFNNHECWRTSKVLGTKFHRLHGLSA